jgi:excinuclease ABC subunit C
MRLDLAVYTAFAVRDDGVPCGMKINSKNKFSLSGQRLYPHFKLTRERFPRLLATRKIFDDGAEYFGAFLPETGVRFLIDFLNKTFRLRTCEIEIDGQFDVPCTQFYRQRCLAPCVENLCDETEYAARVELVRLFLLREISALEKIYLQKIQFHAGNFEFERAAELRDEWQTLEKIFGAKDWNFWLADAVDTFEIVETEAEFFVYLVTMRGRKTLGKRTFVFEKTGRREEILPAVLPEFYRFHAPREIRVSEDFAERSAVAELLSRKFSRQIKITVIRENAPKVMTSRALERTKYEHELRQLRREKPFDEIASDLKTIFKLRKNPARLEGFDVAHISGSDFAAARSVWKNGKFLGKEYAFRFSDEGSELETLRRFIEFRFAQAAIDFPNFPDLILIDGGKAHLKAALQALANLPDRKFTVVSAVKPPRRHGEISHFLTENGDEIDFDGANAAHRVLQTLRDEAHDLSNEIHRQRREMSHFYELAAILPSLGESERRALLKSAGSLKNILELKENDLLKLFAPKKVNSILLDLQHYRCGNARKIEPLIVPLRYTDENGDAQDLRPLASYRTK